MKTVDKVDKMVLSNLFFSMFPIWLHAYENASIEEKKLTIKPPSTGFDLKKAPFETESSHKDNADTIQNLIEYKYLLDIIFKSSDHNLQAGTESMPNRFSLHEVAFDTETSSKFCLDSNQYYSEKKKIIAIINSCYFEYGAWTEADEYFSVLKETSGTIEFPLKLLSDIVNHNLQNEHILEGILHILSYYDYDEINPYGITISLACIANQSPVIQDLLISCFEKWESIESIDILESLVLNQTWLKKYRDEVVEKLKQKAKIA